MTQESSNIQAGPVTSPENASITPAAVLHLWEPIRHFKPSEFDDPTAPGSGVSMNIEFIKILDSIRDKCNFEFRIDSGYRSPEHNADVGGKTDSAHMEGRAVDIYCPDSTFRYQIVAEAVKQGIKRIGIGSTFVHLDMAFDLPQVVIWLYPAKATATNQKPITV